MAIFAGGTLTKPNICAKSSFEVYHLLPGSAWCSHRHTLLSLQLRALGFTLCLDIKLDMLYALHKWFIHLKAASGHQKDAAKSKCNEGSCSRNFAVGMDIFKDSKPEAWRRGGLMVSTLVSGSGGLGQALAGNIFLCSWARHFTLIVLLSTQEYCINGYWQN